MGGTRAASEASAWVPYCLGTAWSLSLDYPLRPRWGCRIWGRGSYTLPSILVALLFVGRSFSESLCLAQAFGGLSCGFSPWAAMAAPALAVGFPHTFFSYFSPELTSRLVFTACRVPCCLPGTLMGREGTRAPASLLPLCAVNPWSFGVGHLRASLTSSCPAQLGQLCRASFGVTLLVQLLYLPFIDNQLLDNKQVFVHSKDCLMGGAW